MSPLRRSLAILFVLLPAASAHAATVPPPSSLTAPVRVPSMGGFSLGSETTTVSYTGTDETVATTAPSVMLGKGTIFRLQTCVQIHLYGRVPVSSCSDRTVDTRANAATVTVAAPTVKLNAIRPSAGGSGYATGQVVVFQQNKLVASSWPDAGLRAGGIALAPVNALRGQLPSVLQGAAVTPMAGAFAQVANGGVNTGAPDSVCAGTPSAYSTPTDSGVSTTGLSGAPARYEIGAPTGEFAGQSPKGTMLILHGGGWHQTDSLAEVRGEADRWRARGWRTVNATYRACGQSLTDALWFYDQIRSQWGSVPTCILGQSAGGHLALTVAAWRSSVSCVIDEAGPSDPASLPSQSTAGGAGNENAKALYNQMVAAFGLENLSWFSPVARSISARVLVAFSASDWVVPWAQATELRDHMLATDPNAYIDAVRLDAGDTPFVHTGVTPAALDDFHARENALVAPLVG
jgi:dienelactone hydrolase